MVGILHLGLVILFLDHLLKRPSSLRVDFLRVYRQYRRQLSWQSCLSGESLPHLLFIVSNCKALGRCHALLLAHSSYRRLPKGIVPTLHFQGFLLITIHCFQYEKDK